MRVFLYALLATFIIGAGSVVALSSAQRLSGGTEALLRKTSIDVVSGKLVLSIPQKYRMLYSEAVERRLVQLGRALGGLKSEARFS